MVQIYAVRTATDAANRFRRETQSPALADKIQPVAVAETHPRPLANFDRRGMAGVANAAIRDGIYFDEFGGTRWPRQFPVPPAPPVVSGARVRSPLEWVALNPQPLPPGPPDPDFSSRLSKVALNPQPLPPRYIGDAVQLAVNLRA